MKLQYENLLPWELKLITEGWKTSSKKQLLMKLFFQGLIIVFLSILFFQHNFLTFTLLFYVVTLIRIYSDFRLSKKFLLETKTVYVFDLIVFKIVLLSPGIVKLLFPSDVVFGRIHKGQKVLLKFSATLRIFDVIIFDTEDDKMLTSVIKKNYSEVSLEKYQEDLDEKGFCILDSVYSDAEIAVMLQQISDATRYIAPTINKSTLYLVKSFFRKNRNIKKFVLNENLREIIKELVGSDVFIVSSFYFDKPGNSKWGVSYHQDRRIIVDKRIESGVFTEWFEEKEQIMVRAPREILEKIITIRVHLDNTDCTNGSLQVIEKSHKKGVYDPKYIDLKEDKEINCDVPRGAIMLMSPLLMHQSLPSTSNKKRRVIHFDVCAISLPENLNWAEKESLFSA